jgi:hypothetical protein
MAMSQRVVFWAGFAAGVAWAIGLLLQSDGAPLDDEIGHYLVARGVWEDPLLLLSLWGRTLNTAIYAIPAAVGLDAVRWFSLVMMAGATLMTWRLGVLLSLRHAYLVPLFFWFQPWVSELSFTGLTEVPFLVLLIGALLCFAQGRLILAGLLIGALPLVRHEGIGLVAAWSLYALATRQWRLLAVLPVPYVLFIAIYAPVMGVLPFGLFTNVKPTEAYGSGGWFHFLPLIGAGAAGVLLPAVYGMPRLPKSAVGMVALGTYALYFFMHVVIFKLGLFASGGYLEFLLPIAPFLALAAAAGVELLEDELVPAAAQRGGSAPRLTTLGIAAVIVLVVAMALRFTEPHRRQPIEAACFAAAQWLRDQGLADRRIEASNVWFYHAMGLDLPRTLDLPAQRLRLDKLPTGTIVAWDEKYSDTLGRPRARIESRPGAWRQLQTFGPNAEVRIYEKL